METKWTDLSEEKRIERIRNDYDRTLQAALHELGRLEREVRHLRNTTGYKATAGDIEEAERITNEIEALRLRLFPETD